MKPVRVALVILIACCPSFGSDALHGRGIDLAAAQEAPEVNPAREPAPPEAAPSGRDLVIPPGREDVLAGMLGQGAELPEGCQLISGHVEYRVVKARYKCPDGEVVFELNHPSRAAATATRTERFAITVQSGSPPGSLVAALESRIRAREAGFEWQLLEPPALQSEGPYGPSAGQSVSWVRLAVAGLFVIAIIGWVVRKRGAGKKTPPLLR